MAYSWLVKYIHKVLYLIKMDKKLVQKIKPLTEHEANIRRRKTI